MNDLAEQYSKMVECATDLADFFLDQEGGTFVLAVVCEILQALLRAGELSAASLVVETIYQMSEIELSLEGLWNRNCQSFFIEQFVDILCEILAT